MAKSSCIAIVAKNAKITEQQAEDVLDAVNARAERLEREKGMAHGDAMLQAQKDLVNEAMAAKAKELQNKLGNLQKRIDRRANMVKTAEAVRHGSDPDLVHAVTNQATARNTPTFGNRASAEAEWAALTREYVSGLSVQLEKAGLLGYFRDGANADGWARELFELSRQSASDDRAQPGITGSPVAAKVADIVHGVQQAARLRANREGAWIGDYAGWITTTQHDSLKLFRAGFDAWRDYILPRLDADRTFEGVDSRDEFLRGAYDGLVSGKHLSDKGEVGMKDPAFTGPANLAAKMSEARKLHFADATGWLQYQREFGRGALNEQVTQTLERSARATALLRRWGTNPETELQADIDFMREHYRTSAPMAVRRLGDATKGIQTRMDYLTGAASVPANLTAAEVAAGIRAVQSMAKLGGVAFTHLSAFTTKAGELRYHGVGFLERWGNSVDSLMQGRGRGDQRELADLLLAGTEGMHGHMLNQFHADDAPAGTVSKLANRFMQASGLTWLLDAQKSGTARIMSRLLGQNMDKGFASLPDELQRTLTSYGISGDAWEAIRGAPRFAIDGREHLTPDAAHGITDDAVKGLRPASGKLSDAAAAAMDTKIRDDLYLKLRMMFLDIADRGVITPGAEEKAMFLRGAQPGSLAGEALRFLAQFKTWGAAAIRQGVGREMYGGQSAMGATAGMFQLTIGSAIMGYLTMTLKDLFKGKTPRSATDPQTLFAALIQGGGFGIMGDYAFGQFNRFGQTPVEALAGPTVGTAADILKMITLGRGLVTGDPDARAKDAGPEALRILQSNKPFINLFDVRRALDYLLFHSMQESMNPGYLQRAERQLQKQTGQQYLGWPVNMSPTNHLKTFGR